jgi:hypothetical protein
MLLNEPICCPLYALSFDGLAIDDQQGVHLVVRTAAARAYLGPDAYTVARRAHILVVALVNSGGDPPRPCAWNRRVDRSVLERRGG